MDLPKVLLLAGAGGEAGVAGAWDVTTANTNYRAFNQSNTPLYWPGNTTTYQCYVSPDESKIFFGSSGNYIQRWDFGEQYKPNTIDWNVVVHTVIATNASNPLMPTSSRILYGINFSPDGTKLILLTYNSAAGSQRFIQVCDLSEAWNIESAVAGGNTSGTVYEARVGDSTIGFDISADGTKFVGTTTTGYVYDYRFTDAWNVRTLTTNTAIFPVSKTTEGIWFGNNGFTLYRAANTNAYSTVAIEQYELNVAYDILTFNNATPTLTYIPKNEQYSRDYIDDIAFSENGDRLYTVGRSYDKVQEHRLYENWNIATAAVDLFGTGQFGTGHANPSWQIQYNDDGSKLYIVENEDVYEYNLPIPYHLGSAYWSGNKFTPNTTNSDLGAALKGFRIENEGRKLFIYSGTNYKVGEFTLQEPWNVATAYSQWKFKSGEEATPRAFHWKPDGSRFYISGSSADKVFQYDVQDNWNIANATYSSDTGQMKLVTETFPTSLHISNNGLYMYSAGYTYDNVTQYIMSDAWNIATAQVHSNLYIGHVCPQIQTLTFSEDGTKMFVGGDSLDELYQYNLTEAWNIQTATTNAHGNYYYAKRHSGMNMLGTTAIMYDGMWKPDGTAFYQPMPGERGVLQHDVPDAWNIGSAATWYMSGRDVNNTAAFALNGREIAVSNTGDKIYVLDGTNIWQWDLESPYHLKSFTHTQAGRVGDQSYKSIVAEDMLENTPYSMTFSEDGKFMYISGHARHYIAQFYLTTPWDAMTAVNEFTPRLASLHRLCAATAYGIGFANNGNNFYMLDSSEWLYQFKLQEPYRVSSAEPLSRHGDRVYLPFGNPSWSVGEFNSDGTIYYQPEYHATAARNNVRVYTLSESYNVASETSNLELSGFLTNHADVAQVQLRAIRFNDTGDKVYAVGTSNNYIYQYSLSESWNLQTKTWETGYNFATQISGGATDFRFSNDGTKLFIIDYNAGDDINAYELSEAWNVATATYLHTSIAFTANSNGPYTLAFNNDGTRVYKSGNEAWIHALDLNEAWNVAPGSLNARHGSYFRTELIANGVDQYSPWGLKFAQNGNSYFIATRSGAAGQFPSVHKFETANGYDLFNSTDPTYAGTMNIIATYPEWLRDTLRFADTTPYPKGLEISPDGNTLIIVDQANNSTWSTRIAQFNMSESWNLSTATFANLAPQWSHFTYHHGTPTGLAIDPTGTWLFTTTTNRNGGLYKLRMREPWQVNNMYSGIASTYRWESSPATGYINAEGTKMITIGNSNRFSNWNFKTPWEIGTAFRTHESYEMGGIIGHPRGHKVFDDGKQHVVFGSSGRILYSELETPYEVSTAVERYAVAWHMDANSVNTGFISSDSVEEMKFSTDGSKVFLLNTTNNNIYEYDLSTPYDFRTVSYVQNSGTLTTGETAKSAMAFNADGTRVYVAGTTLDKIYEHVLTDPWNVGPGSLVQCTPIFSMLQETEPRGMYVSPDGLHMYMVGITQDTIYEYSGNTANILSTFSNTGRTLSITSLDTDPQEITFNPTGTKMYVVGNTNSKMLEWNLVEAWNISTAYQENQNVSITGQETNPTGIFFGANGTLMYVIGSTGDDINLYTLGDPYNPFSATFRNTTSISAQETVPQDIFFSPDGTKMYVTGSTGDDTNEYTLSTPWIPATLTFEGTFSYVLPTLYDAFPQGIFIDSNGQYLYMVGTNSDDVFQFEFAEAWNTATLSYLQSLDCSGIDATPSSIRFKPDGTKMYLSGGGAETVYEFAVPEAWNIASIDVTSTANLAVPASETNITAIDFNEDGTKIYMLGTADDTIYQMHLSTAWDITTASAGDMLLSSAEPYSNAFTFNSDGTKGFSIGLNRTVYEWNFATPYKTSTGTLGSNTFYFSTESQPTGVEFKPDGTMMYIIGYNTDKVYSFDLSEAWNVNTAISNTSYLVSGQEAVPQSVRFADDGYKMFVLGSQGDNIDTYVLSEAWNVASANVAHEFNIADRSGSITGLSFGNNGNQMYVTDANYTYEYTLAQPYLPDTGKWAGTRYYHGLADYGGEAAARAGVAFSDDSTKMYIMGTSYSKIVQVNLNEAGKIESNTGVVWASCGVASAFGLQLSANGEYLYLTSTANQVRIYDLETPYSTQNVGSTAVYGFIGQHHLNTLGSLESATAGLHFSPNGEYMFVCGTSQLGQKFDLSEPWNVATAFCVANADASYKMGTTTVDVRGIHWKPDGTMFWVFHETTEQMQEYLVDTPWDIANAYVSDRMYVGREEGSLYGATFKRGDGTKLFITGPNQDRVKDYDFATEYELSSVRANANLLLVNGLTGNPGSVTFDADGTRMYITDYSAAFVYQFYLPEAWNITSAVTRDMSLTTASGTARNMFFSNNGMKLYVGRDATIETYDLISPYYVSGATQNTEQLLTTHTRGEAMWINDDGTKLYTGWNNTAISTWDVAEAWNLATATQTNTATMNTTHLNGGNYVSGMDFDNTGHYMTLFCPSATRGHRVYLSDPYNIESAYNKGVANGPVISYYHDVGIYDTTAGALHVGNSGHTLYYAGQAIDDVLEFYMEEPYNLATMNYTGRLIPLASDTHYVSVSEDGTKLWVGQADTQVWQYDLSTPFDLSSATETYRQLNFQLPLRLDSYNQRVAGGVAASGRFRGLWIHPDGRQGFFAHATSGLPPTSNPIDHVLYEFPIGEYWNLAQANIHSFSAQQLTTDSQSGYGATWLNNGNTLFTSRYHSSFASYNLPIAYEVGTASFAQTETQNAAIKLSATPHQSYGGMVPKTVGNSVYDFATFNSMIKPIRYPLHTANSIANGSFFIDTNQIDYANVGTFEPYASGMAFKADGSKVFIVGSLEDSVYSMELLEAWNISTAVLDFANAGRDSRTSVTGETALSGMFVNPAGNKMYILGTTLDTVFEYDLPVANGIHSAVYSGNSVLINHTYGAPGGYVSEGTPGGISFSPDGTIMYVIGQQRDRIEWWGLTTPWDLSTAQRPWNYTSTDSGVAVTNPLSAAFGNNGYRLIRGIATTIYQMNLTEAYNVATAVTDGRTAGWPLVGGSGLSFSNTGDKLFMSGYNGTATIYEAALSEPWNVASNTFTNYVNTHVVSYDHYWAANGTILYHVGNNDYVYRYDVSTPWDLSTAAQTQALLVTSLWPAETDPRSVGFNADGTKMYIAGTVADQVIQFDLATPWDLDTASNSGVEFTRQFNYMDTVMTTLIYRPELGKGWIQGTTYDRMYEFQAPIDSAKNWYIANSYLVEMGTPYSIKFKPDGTRRYMLAGTKDMVMQRELEVPWNPASNTVTNTNFWVSELVRTPTMLEFSANGSFMYVGGSTSDRIYQYHLSDAWNIESAGIPMYMIRRDVAEGNITAVSFSNTGDKMFAMGIDRDNVYTWDLSTSWSVNTAVFNADQVLALNPPEGGPQVMRWSTNGEYLFIGGTSRDRVNRYALSEAWNVASNIELTETSVITDTALSGIDFNPEGTIMYVSGSTSDDIRRITLSTPWDLSTAVFDANGSATLDNFLEYTPYHGLGLLYPATIATVYGLEFSNTGKQFFVIDDTNKFIIGFECAEAYNVATANANTRFEVSTEMLDTNIESAKSIKFNNNGTKLYIASDTGSPYYSLVFEIDLSVPYDIRTGIFPSYYVSRIDTVPTGLVGSANGHILWVAGSGGLIGSYLSEVQYALKFPVEHIDDMRYMAADIAYIGTRDNFPRAIQFNTDGDKMFTIGSQLQRFDEYLLTGEWQPGTKQFQNTWPISLVHSLVTTAETVPEDMWFSSDGTKLYLVGSAQKTVNQYKLRNPYDLSTISMFNYNIQKYDATPTGIAFSNTGDKMYMVGYANTSKIYQFDLTEAFEPDSAVFSNIVFNVNHVTIPAVTTTRGSAEIRFNADGTALYYSEAQANTIHKAVLYEPWNIASASFAMTRLGEGGILAGRGFTVSGDGEYLYSLSDTDDTIYQYKLDRPYDISSVGSNTQSYVDKFVFTGNLDYHTVDTDYKSIRIGNDGNTMWVLANTNIHQFDLATPYVISSMYSKWSIPTQEDTGIAAASIGTSGVTTSFNGNTLYSSCVTQNKIHMWKIDDYWNMASRTYVGAMDMAAITTNTTVTDLRSIQVSYDGTKMLALANNGARSVITEYRMTELWNVMTAYEYNYFDLTTATGDIYVQDMSWADFGNKLYVTGNSTDKVWEFDVPSWYELDGITSGLNRTHTLLGVGTEPDSLAFAAGGDRMYFWKRSSSVLYQLDLTESYNIETATVSLTLSYADVIRRNQGRTITFSVDGKYMLMGDASQDNMWIWPLVENWNVATSAGPGKMGTRLLDTVTNGFAFSNTGHRIYTIGQTGDDINEFDILGDPYDVNSARYSRTSFNISGYGATLQSLQFNEDGTKVYVVGIVNDTIYEFGLSEAWNIASMYAMSPNFAYSTDYPALYRLLEANPTEMKFSANGSLLYLGGTSGFGHLTQFHLDEPFDIRTIRYPIIFTDTDVLGNGTVGDFSNTGESLFVMQNNANYPKKIVEYGMINTAFDISRARRRDQINHELFLPNDSGKFSVVANNGYDVYTLNRTTDAIHRYRLSNPYEFSNAELRFYNVNMFSVTNEEATPQSFAISANGDYLYVIGTTGDDVNQYVMSEPFNIASATLDYTTAALGETNPRGIRFKPDGTKFYINGVTGLTFKQFDLSTPWNVASATAGVDSAAMATLLPGHPAPGVVHGFDFNADGTELTVVATISNCFLANTITLTEAWNTATLTAKTDDANSLWSDGYLMKYLYGIDWGPNGDTVIVSGTHWHNSDVTVKYRVTDSYNIASMTPFYANVSPDLIYPLAGTLKSMKWLDNGNTMFALEVADYPYVHQWDFSTPYDLSTISYQGNANLYPATTTTVQSMTVSPDGTKLFIVDTTKRNIQQFRLGVPFDITSLYFNHMIIDNEFTPTSISFKRDGKKMYIVGEINKTIQEYNLPTAWEVGSAVAGNSYSIGHDTDQPEAMAWKPDGGRMYVLQSDVGLLAGTHSNTHAGIISYRIGRGEE